MADRLFYFLELLYCFLDLLATTAVLQHPGGRRVLPYIGYINMCRYKKYGFQAVQSRIENINQIVWVQKRASFFTKLTSWLNVLSRLRKPVIATQKYEKIKSTSLIYAIQPDNYHETLLDINNFKKSGFKRKSVVLILVIKYSKQ